MEDSKSNDKMVNKEGVHMKIEEIYVKCEHQKIKESNVNKPQNIRIRWKGLWIVFNMKSVPSGHHSNFSHR